MSAPKPLRLGVNVDHVATVRNQRDGTHPDPLAAALSALKAGADSITVHLREDRRHIRDDDVKRIHAAISAPLNLEMAITPEMIDFACTLRPHACCLVPEKRTERTTEGGLEITRQRQSVREAVRMLSHADIRVSLFIEATEESVRAAVDVGAPVVELHTGTWCETVASPDEATAGAAFTSLQEAARLAARLGLEVHAGHGLDEVTAEAIATFPELAELNIGHALVGEAILHGMPEAVRRMRAAMDRGRARAMVAA